MYDLFDVAKENRETAETKPLAERMRPNSLREFIGQGQILEDGSLLRRAISLDKVGSCIFWGPPGTGKTTLANIIANSTSGNFVKLNAVSSGVADVKKAVDEARENLKLYGTNVTGSAKRSRTVFFPPWNRERSFLSVPRRKIRMPQ